MESFKGNGCFEAVGYRTAKKCVFIVAVHYNGIRGPFKESAAHDVSDDT